MKSTDRKFLKSRIRAQKTRLPESLGEAQIASLVSEQPQRAARRKRVPAWVPSLAAMLALSLALTAVIGAVGPSRVIHNLAPSQPAQQETPAAEPDPAEVQASYKTLAGTLSAHYEAMNADDGSAVWNPLVRFYSNSFRKSYGGDFAVQAEEDSAQSYNTAPAAAPSMSGVKSSDDDYSRLNTRTEGVDETDIFRTDGKYLYVLNGATGGYYMWYGNRWGWGGMINDASAQRFTVVDPNGGDMKALGEYRITLNENGAEEINRERSMNGFYLYGDTAVLIGSETRFTEGSLKRVDEGNGEGYYWDLTADARVDYYTVVLVLNVSDPADITLEKELYFDGDLISSRISGGRLITVSRYSPDWSGFNADDYTTFVPRAGEYGCYLPAGRIYIADENSEQYIVTGIVPLEGGDYAAESLAVLGAADDIYCSGDNIYCYGRTYTYANEEYETFFTLQKIDVSGSVPVQKASGKYKGMSILEQFSIDEYNGLLRLAVQTDGRSTALGQWIPGENYILILDENLDVIGQSESFGKNENIRSVRFMGEKAYVVTFLNTDPLFAFDLSDPAKPVITGETKLPGYSAYMHPIAEGYMLGVGYDGTETGTNGDAKLSLFDISDPADPKETDRFILENGWFNTDYKSFMVKGENGCIVITSRWDEKNSLNLSGAVYVTAENGDLNVVSQFELPENAYLNKALFIGNVFYAFAQKSEPTEDAYNDDGYYLGSYTYSEVICALDLTSGALLGELPLGEAAE